MPVARAKKSLGDVAKGDSFNVRHLDLFTDYEPAKLFTHAGEIGLLGDSSALINMVGSLGELRSLAMALALRLSLSFLPDIILKIIV
jgi:hypothetical protein